MLAKILLVDDSASDRLIIKSMLSNYNVLVACDGIEAMRQIDEHDDIDLVILDLNMPNMDGFQVLETLNSDERYNRLRTIILTNYDELDNEIKGLELGAVDYIRKPIHIDSLRARVNIHTELIRIQKLLEQKIYEQALTFDTIFKQAPIGIAISHSMEPFNSNSSIIISMNPMFEQITGRTKEEILELGWANITHPDDLEEDIKNFKKLQAGEMKSYSMEKRYIKPDGSIVWVHMIVAPLMYADDHLYNHICLVQDITIRKTVEADLMESERSKSVFLSHLPGLAYRCNYDREWTMQYVSAGCLELTGYAPESLLYNRDLSYNDLITPEYREPLWEEWKRILARRLPFQYEYEIQTAKGERKWVIEMGQGVYNEEGAVVALEGIVLDISYRKEIENNLRYKNEHDSLTGLYNRSYLENLLKKDAELMTTEKRAVVSINLSAVQSLTLTYGFHYTQELVKKIADALNLHCTDKRLLFNTYENRFVFYVIDYKDKRELMEFCETIISTLESLLAMERIGGGIGVLEIDQDNARDVDQLLKKLLIASERAISFDDRDFGICFYDTETEDQILREQEIKRELTQIEADENDSGLLLQYQPILDLKSNQICGFEALARLDSDKLGRVPPLKFIPIAEKTKLIIPIGRKVMLQAFRFLNKLKENGYGTICISINVSVIQLLKDDFCKNLFEMIEQMQVSAENVSLEVTESVFASNYQEINRILGELKDCGIRIAIDDFGTGYSSLARERELNVNCLKIDKYFIDKLLSLKPEEAITGDIISMAHKFNHCVVAEGVEYEKQRQYLKDFGCDKIQGYLISKPLDEEAAIEMLKSNS
ncbi:MAG TPA: EAL domain-containing protein [Bacillota bacterium]|nr:EAL domain-containing protein [Bacillota bacterium]